MITPKGIVLAAVAVAGSGLAAQMGVALEAIKFTSAVVGLVALVHNLLFRAIRKTIREEMSKLACIRTRGVICDKDEPNA